jgi:hypothetical protein
MSTNQAPAPTALPDRSARLMVAGIFEILLGCFCLLLVVMMGGVLAAQTRLQGAPAQGLNAAAIVQALLIYMLAAVAFIWVGIGLAKARRWAWALTVAWSWVWLVVGAFGFLIVLCVMGHGTWAAIAEQGKLPPQMATVMRITTTVMLGCIYIVVPGLLLALCHPKSVRATCERRDPKRRWTDRCPLPVLALSLVFALSLISMFSMAAYRWTLPVFGSYVSGATGAALVVLIAVVLAWLAWGTYRLQPAAWWGALVVFVVGTANAVVMFAAMDLSELYKKMGMPADQIELMQKAGILEMLTRWGPGLGVAGGIGWLGYLVFLRRYFFGAKVASPAGEQS